MKVERKNQSDWTVWLVLSMDIRTINDIRYTIYETVRSIETANLPRSEGSSLFSSTLYIYST